MANRGTVILPSFYEAIKDLPNADRLAMYDCIVRYGLYGETADLPAHLRGYFTLIRPYIDSSRKRYETAVENGKKGGAPIGNHNAQKQPENNQSDNQTNNHDINTDFDSDINTDSKTDINNQHADKPPRAPRFVPPTVEEVSAYCRERENSVDAQSFVDHYQANGWMRGKNKIRDWKACVRTWEKNRPTQTSYNYDYSGEDSL